MAQFKSDLLNTLSTRGYLHQCTDLEGLDVKAKDSVITCYVGYDATADSLHIGNLVSIMMLRRLQQTGHRPIALMGGGTTKVGDPSGRDETRVLADNDTINARIAKIQQTFGKFLNFGSGKTDALLMNNADWLDKLEYIPFLRDIGRHFTVNRMLTMDSVKLRLEREQPLTFLEFNYMIMQGYDFVELYRRVGCTMQMGGSDQWGNIVQGVELGRRIVNTEFYGLTTPLITKSSGEKMGKSVSGAVWLSAEKLSPYDYYQFWRNTEDADVARFMKLFTDMPLDEIARYETLQGAEINEGKKKLALEATALLHGKDNAESAAETARKTFEEGSTSGDLPTLTFSAAELSAGVGVLDALVKFGMAESKGEARRLIRGGGAKLNDAKIDDENATIKAADLQNGVAKISAGKKRHGLIKQS